MSTESPASPRLAEEAGGWAAAYVHIPFCARLCPYCDFAVVTGRDQEIGRYLRALEAEIESEAPWRQLDSVYFGGGTPSAVDPDQLAGLLTRLEKQFGLSPEVEVSLEANPEDWTSHQAGALREAGFTRVSFGAQSFDQRVLLALGRRHFPQQTETAIASARAAGFSSVNLDLIYGTPGESLADWARTVDQALVQGPDHLSCYALTVEPGTELHRQVAVGVPGPDSDLQADQWELADERATDAGLVRYEVSNWARPGHAVRYNLAVWAQSDYLAFGLGAHRFRDGLRSNNFRRLDSYLEAIEGGKSPIAGSEEVAGWDRETERLFLGLRRAAGAAPGAAGAALLASEEGQHLRALGIISADGERIVVRRPLLTDAVSRVVLALSPPDC